MFGGIVRIIKMSSFVLVHGSWHGAWCWAELAPILESRGHRVCAPDLPGHGSDETPFDAISLASYATVVKKALSFCLEPPILVAHSLAGMVVTSLPADALAFLECIVCVAAYIPKNGQSLTELAKQDKPSLTRRHCIISKDRLRLLLPRSIVPKAIYNDCDGETVARALSQMRPDPLFPNVERVVYDSAALDKIKKYYVECRKDRAVSPDLQRRMQNHLKFEETFILESDHVPMISHVQDLADVLLKIAGKTARLRAKS